MWCLVKQILKAGTRIGRFILTADIEADVTEVVDEPPDVLKETDETVEKAQKDLLPK